MLATGALREKTFITGVPGEKKLETGALREKKLDTAEQHVMSSYYTDAHYWLIVLSTCFSRPTDDLFGDLLKYARIESFFAHSARIVRFSAHGTRVANIFAHVTCAPSVLHTVPDLCLQRSHQGDSFNGLKKTNATVRQPRIKKDPPTWAGPWQCKCNISQQV